MISFLPQWLQNILRKATNGVYARRGLIFTIGILLGYVAALLLNHK